ncbi:E3 ubiquitin-protein ligase RNF170 [Selaginella moellendorffii]|nr:E3 ubiquitin-protein ligase RNF170 [Selaginella moellendorffii]|eukprot:XP_002966179.2 E3 ubiquitin-protein ligase RNF170 [Selaginella moellendorffii]
MPYIEGIGDEVVLAAVFAAPAVIVYCSSAGVFARLRKGLQSLGVWIVQIFQISTAPPPLDHPPITMEAPDENDCCSVCHDTFTLPCQANCAHWFCGECILRVWQHSAALQPCKCPICRRTINLLIPGREYQERNRDAESERLLREISKYNRLFGGAPSSVIQRLRDMPLLLRRFFRDLLDPQRALLILHRTRFILVVFLSMCYVLSPIDLLPEAVLGLIGLVDDALVVFFALFQVSMIYRRFLVRQHGNYS